MNAIERATELMGLSSKDIPEKAKRYAQHMCRLRGGSCAETIFTAFIHYAEVCEGLERSSDPMYQADDFDRLVLYDI